MPLQVPNYDWLLRQTQQKNVVPPLTATTSPTQETSQQTPAGKPEGEGQVTEDKGDSKLLKSILAVGGIGLLTAIIANQIKHPSPQGRAFGAGLSALGQQMQRRQELSKVTAMQKQKATAQKQTDTAKAQAAARKQELGIYEGMRQRGDITPEVYATRMREMGAIEPIELVASGKEMPETELASIKDLQTLAGIAPIPVSEQLKNYGIEMTPEQTQTWGKATGEGESAIPTLTPTLNAYLVAGKVDLNDSDAVATFLHDHFEEIAAKEDRATLLREYTTLINLAMASALLTRGVTEPSPEILSMIRRLTPEILGSMEIPDRPAHMSKATQIITQANELKAAYATNPAGYISVLRSQNWDIYDRDIKNALIEVFGQVAVDRTYDEISE